MHFARSCVRLCEWIIGYVSRVISRLTCRRTIEFIVNRRKTAVQTEATARYISQTSSIKIVLRVGAVSFLPFVINFIAFSGCLHRMCLTMDVWVGVSVRVIIPGSPDLHSKCVSIRRMLGISFGAMQFLCFVLYIAYPNSVVKISDTIIVSYVDESKTVTFNNVRRYVAVSTGIN